MAQQRERPSMAATKDANKQRYIRRAIESASEYNLFLNRQRQRVYMDLQTDTPNYPVGLGRDNKTLTRTNKIGRFPVAVIPSQYQDWYIEYTPEELDFLPVDTVLRGPIMRIDQLPPVLTTPDVSDFESDSDSCCSTSSEDCSSCCSCCAQNDAKQQQQEQQDQQANANNTSNPSDETATATTATITPISSSSSSSNINTTTTTSARRKSHSGENHIDGNSVDSASLNAATTNDITIPNGPHGRRTSTNNHSRNTNNYS